LRQRGPRAVDAEIGARAQGLKIGDQALIERYRPRSRQRRQDGTIEDRYRDNFIVAEFRTSPALETIEHTFKAAPVRFPLDSKTAALQLPLLRPVPSPSPMSLPHTPHH